MKDLNYYKRSWPIKVEKEIHANIKDLWDIISRDGNLNDVHPFCKENYSISWDGINSIDVLEYLNGLKFIREFMTWEPEIGYSLLIGTKNGKKSYVVWEISSKNYKNYLSITVYPHFMRKYPKIISYFPHKIIVEPYLKKYLKSVIGGIDYYLENRKTVPRNYFGKHEWFSEK